MLTRGKTQVHRDPGGARHKVCECGAKFPVEFNTRGQMTSRALCDDCRLKRTRRAAGNLPNTAGVPRCEDCSALLGLSWGTVTHLDEDGRCPACAAWHLKTLEREQKERNGYTNRGGLWTHFREAQPRLRPARPVPVTLIPQPKIDTPRGPLPIPALADPGPARKRYNDEGYTTAEAARQLGATRGAVRHLIAQGKLRARKDGDVYIVDRAQVDTLARGAREEAS